MLSPHPQSDSCAAEAQTFCNTLWPLCDAYVEIRAKRGQEIARRIFHRRRMPPFAKMLANLPDWNVWVGVALRREDGDGGRANCSLLFTVHVDADLKDAARAAIFAEALERFPLPPTMVVASGSPHSFHVYWRLRKPLVLQDADGKIRPDVEEAYRRVVVGLAEHFGGDPTVADLPRVMRLPGSRNVKPANGGTPVHIIRRDPLRRYNLSEFEPWLAAPLANVETRRGLVRERSTADGGRVSSEDAVDFFEEFSQRGDLLEDAGSGMFFVRCPWIEEHSGYSGISETAIWAPTSEGDAWGFRCQHSHCRNRRGAQVYEYLRLMRAANQLGFGRPA